jgi:hypothetical protein
VTAAEDGGHTCKCGNGIIFDEQDQLDQLNRTSALEGDATFFFPYTDRPLLDV